MEFPPNMIIIFFVYTANKTLQNISGDVSDLHTIHEGRSCVLEVKGWIRIGSRFLIFMRRCVNEAVVRLSSAL